MDGKSFFPSENGEEIKLYSFNVKREAFLKSGLQKSGSRVLMRSKIRAMRWNVILKRSRQSLLCMPDLAAGAQDHEFELVLTSQLL